MDGPWGTEEVVICVAVGHSHFFVLGCCDAIVGEKLELSLWLSICGRGARVVLASVITVPLSAVFSRSIVSIVKQFRYNELYLGSVYMNVGNLEPSAVLAIHIRR